MGELLACKFNAMIIEEIAINNFDLLVIIFCIEGVMGVSSNTSCGDSKSSHYKNRGHIHRIGSMHVPDDLNNT